MIDVRKLSTQELQEMLARAQNQLTSQQQSPNSSARISPNELQSTDSKIEMLVGRVMMAEHCLSSLIESSKEKDCRINNLESRLNSQNQSVESHQNRIAIWSHGLFRSLENRIDKLEEVRSPMHSQTRKPVKNKSFI